MITLTELSVLIDPVCENLALLVLDDGEVSAHGDLIKVDWTR